MTKSEFCENADELELVLRQLKRICKQLNLAELSIATFKDGVCWCTCKGKDSEDADRYELNLYNDGHVTYDCNQEEFYIKS